MQGNLNLYKEMLIIILVYNLKTTLLILRDTANDNLSNLLRTQFLTVRKEKCNKIRDVKKIL